MFDLAQRPVRSPRRSWRTMPRAATASPSQQQRSTAICRAVIVGGSSGVGRALAEELASRGIHLVLVATDRRDLESLQADLQLRHGVTVHCDIVDLNDSAFDPYETCLRWRAMLGGCDALLVPAGYVESDDDGLPPARTIEQTLKINFTAPAQLITACSRLFERQGHGTIVAFSSIAAAVPRRKRMAYSAAKAALEAYLRGLRHYFSGTAIRIQTYALGYVDTSMSFGQKLLLPVATPQSVARRVVSNLPHDVGLTYCPRFWWGITRILQSLPWFLFRRLKF